MTLDDFEAIADQYMTPEPEKAQIEPILRSTDEGHARIVAAFLVMLRWFRAAKQEGITEVTVSECAGCVGNETLHMWSCSLDEPTQGCSCTAACCAIIGEWGEVVDLSEDYVPNDRIEKEPFIEDLKREFEATNLDISLDDLVAIAERRASNEAE
jgi:hypothetical protein